MSELDAYIFLFGSAALITLLAFWLGDVLDARRMRKKEEAEREERRKALEDYLENVGHEYLEKIRAESSNRQDRRGA